MKEGVVSDGFLSVLNCTKKFANLLRQATVACDNLAQNGHALIKSDMFIQIFLKFGTFHIITIMVIMNMYSLIYR